MLILELAKAYALVHLLATNATGYHGRTGFAWLVRWWLGKNWPCTTIEMDVLLSANKSDNELSSVVCDNMIDVQTRWQCKLKIFVNVPLFDRAIQWHSVSSCYTSELERLSCCVSIWPTQSIVRGARSNNCSIKWASYQVQHKFIFFKASLLCIRVVRSCSIINTNL